jgi:hypothetical protein
MSGDVHTFLTVGELMAFLTSLPQNQPLFRSGNGGSFSAGIVVKARKLAQHKHVDYHADVNDPVWLRSDKRGGPKKSVFNPEFEAITIG